MSEEPRDLNLLDRMIPMKGGKEYLQVADRIVWFRRDYPEGTIETKLLELDRDKGFAMYHARITTGKGGVAEASGSETAKDFGDYIEKSETKAVGRALGYLGFGTASAGFEEGQRIVDAPQTARAQRAAAPAPARPVAAPPQTAPPPLTKEEYTAVIAEAWRMRQAGEEYRFIVAYLRTHRDRLSADQYEDSVEEMRLIKRATPIVLEEEEVAAS